MKSLSNSALPILLRIVVTTAALILAFVGFLQAYPAPHGGRGVGEYAEHAYQAVQLAFAQFPAELRGKPVPPALQISRFLMPLAAAWVTLSLGWMSMRNRARAWIIRRRGDHLVVFGEGVLAEGLVKGERAHKGRIIAWVEDGAGRLARDAEALGGAHADGARGALDLKQLGLEKARAFVAAADSDAANMEVSRRVLDHALEHRKPGDPLQLIARIDDLALQGALESRMTRRDQRDRAELRLASAPQLLARQFLLADPIDRLAPAPGQPVRLCWIGWSALAESMLVRVLASAHYNQEARLELIVADLNADRAEAAFRSRRPGAAEIAPVRFAALKDDAPTLVAEWLTGEAAAAPLNAVYVTLADSSGALSTGLAIESALTKRGLVTPPLYVHLPDSGADARGLVDDSVMQPFGAVAALADPEVLLQERHDEIARAIHEFYLEGRLSEGEAMGDRPTLLEWRDLPESVRDENRLVADCYTFKLRGIGAAIVEGRGESMRFAPEEVELLAEAEHRRWMAGKLLNGWVHGETRDDTAKRHPDILPYPALSEHIKDLDREQIRMIPRMLAASGRRVLRDLRVAFQPSGTAGGSRSLRSTLRGFATSHPDRRVVAVGELTDPGARQLLSEAAALGTAVELVLRGPVQPLLDSLTGPERARTVSLLRSADRLHALGPGKTAPAPDLVAPVELSIPIPAPAPGRRAAA